MKHSLLIESFPFILLTSRRTFILHPSSFCLHPSAFILIFMRVAFLSSEVVPFAKTGGLADVAGALPAALCEQRYR
jgi:hypothetical protein